MLGYRMFFQTSRRDAIEEAMAQLHAWLRGKKYDADALTDGELVRLADSAEGVLVNRLTQDGARSLRARVTDSNQSGEWVTQLTVHVPGRATEASWVWLDVESPASRQWTATPRLARYLLEVFRDDARDGESLLGPVARPVGQEDVEWLLDVVCDPDRRCPAILAGDSAVEPLPNWPEAVTGLLKHAVGLAGVYVLDGAATAAFRDLLGVDTHAVAAGTIRTFLPAADPADAVDARRHKILGTERILRSESESLARLLGWKAREAATSTPLPGAALRLGRSFDEELNSLLVKSLTGGPEPVRTVETPVAVTPESVAELGALARAGQLAKSRQEAIGRRLHAQQVELEALQDEHHLLRERFIDEQLEHADTVDELVRAQRKVEHLQRLLVDRGKEAEAYSEPVGSPDTAPGSCGDLVVRVAELRYVQFTGEKDPALDLDDHDPLGNWARKAWAALLALADYAEASHAGRCSRDVHGYLSDLPEGCRGYPVNKHARDESKDVHCNPKFKAARVLPVPPEVAPSGRVFMGAHFKIAKSGLVTPRLHYYDDTARTGKVYVGYLGRHLPTKHTN